MNRLKFGFSDLCGIPFYLVFVAQTICILCAIPSRASDTLLLWNGPEAHYLAVDTTRIMIRWRPFDGTIEESGYLSDYPSIARNQYEINAADEYYMHHLSGTYEFNSLYMSLVSSQNVVSVNRVLLTTGNVPIYFGDKIILLFNKETGKEQIDSLFLEHQLAVVRESRYVANEYVVIRSAESSMATLELANYLQDLPLIEWAHPIWFGNFQLYGYSVLDSLFHVGQWNVKRAIGYKSTSNFGAWEVTRGGASVKIAILDAGMEWHEDIDTTLWEQGYDFYDGDPVPAPLATESKTQFDSHGMMVLGLISGRHNNLVLDSLGQSNYWSAAGVAPTCRIIPVRISAAGDRAESYLIEDALYFAQDTGANIINCSWGYNDIPYPIEIVNGIGNILQNNEIVIVAAAGNFGPSGGLGFPAISPDVIAVGASDVNDYVCYYSSGGPTLDVVAPSGDDVGICYGSCPSSNYLIDRMGTLGYSKMNLQCSPKTDPDYFCRIGGTSSAAPLVTGIAALLKSIDTSLLPVQVSNIIKFSSNRVLHNDTISQGDPAYGWGRVSAVRALSTLRRGDCNVSGSINVVDMTIIINYLFHSAPAPFPDKYFGDADCNGSVNIADVNYLTQYLFNGGPAPQNPCTAFLLD